VCECVACGVRCVGVWRVVCGTVGLWDCGIVRENFGVPSILHPPLFTLGVWECGSVVSRCLSVSISLCICLCLCLSRLGVEPRGTLDDLELLSRVPVPLHIVPTHDGQTHLVQNLVFRV